MNTEDRLDILINNAGLALFGEQEKTLTEDGNELTLQSNHLGHFLLTNLLMDKMEEFPGSRIVNVSSIAHQKPSKFSRAQYLDINYTLHEFSQEIFSRKNVARNFSREIQCKTRKKFKSRNRRKRAPEKEQI